MKGGPGLLVRLKSVIHSAALISVETKLFSFSKGIAFRSRQRAAELQCLDRPFDERPYLCPYDDGIKFVLVGIVHVGAEARKIYSVRGGARRHVWNFGFTLNEQVAVGDAFNERKWFIAIVVYCVVDAVANASGRGDK